MPGLLVIAKISRCVGSSCIDRGVWGDLRGVSQGRGGAVVVFLRLSTKRCGGGLAMAWPGQSPAGARTRISRIVNVSGVFQPLPNCHGPWSPSSSPHAHAKPNQTKTIPIPFLGPIRIHIHIYVHVRVHVRRPLTLNYIHSFCLQYI